jgi:hypothetical protein
MSVPNDGRPQWLLEHGIQHWACRLVQARPYVQDSEIDDCSTPKQQILAD